MRAHAYPDLPEPKLLIHSLVKLWQVFTLEFYDAIGDCVKQFEKLGPRSEAFRHPFDTSGQPSCTRGRAQSPLGVNDVLFVIFILTAFMLNCTF